MGVKIALRDLLTACLNTLPERSAAMIRRRHAQSVPGSAPFRFLHTVLSVLRYRHISSNVTDFTLPDNPAIRFVRDNSYITRRIYWYGTSGYERSVLAAWTYLCGRATNVLEIGANIGYFTVHGARAAPNTRYTTVEPHPVSAEILRRNVEINGIANVEVIEAAVVGQKRHSKMQLATPSKDPDGAPAGAHLIAVSERSLPVRAVVDVDVVQAADLFRGIDLLKLDVEGSEHDILSSLLPLIYEQRTSILVELLSDVPLLRDLIADMMAEGGYRAFAIGESRLYPIGPDEIRTIRLSRRYGTRDLVLLPRNFSHLDELEATILHRR
jgi:FkbM family methyltransferase